MKTRVLFLCWGFSIHAKRRIQIFVDDPAFEVTVASTHNYNFQPANNVSLTAARICSSPKTIWEKIIHKIASSPEIAWLIDYFILARATKRYQPDVIFLQTLIYPCFLAYFLPRKIPQMITFWNGDVTWWAKWNGIERLLKKQIVTYGARRAAAVTVNSQIACTACLKYEVSPDRIHLIGYPGVDLTKFFPQSKTAAREQLGITSPQVILWPRGLGGYLNSELFIQAMAQVARKYPNSLAIVLSGVGGPNELGRHQEMAQALQIEHNFRWVGQVNFEDMPLYYNSADVMVSISSNDSRPNVMLEAMACSTPVIIGDIPATREWITANHNGYLVPPQDIEQLAQTIIQVLDPENQTANLIYTERSLQLVRERADSQKNIALIKQLVYQVAYASASGQ